MKNKLKLIEQYYLKALTFVNDKNIKKACDVLYHEMPIELYDLSIDILYNRNIEFSNKNLRGLIESVDNALIENHQEEGLLKDDFKGQF